MEYFICVIYAVVGRKKAENLFFLFFFMGREAAKNSIQDFNMSIWEGRTGVNRGETKKEQFES